MQVIWLVLIVLFVVVEAATAALVSTWFAIGALAALVVSFVLPEVVWLQILVFVLVSALALAALRPLSRRFLKTGNVPTNTDANIGKICQVVTEIQPARFGRVKLENLEWMAQAEYILPVGTWCRVQAIEGVKLVVTPLAQEQHPA